ncbi:MAG: hypothetical protein JSV88_23545 [Candidatus Aminicenantes bacterium]|nr:MAG: hypothetical protein JSV88_23545 [Candidatus Aminicenantes bacterium]
MVLFLVLTTWCYGYIDPGTGSYLIQIIIAVIAGAALGVKLSWKKIKRFFANLLSKDNTNNTSSK